MTLLTSAEGLSVFAVFTAAVLLTVLFTRKKNPDLNTFLVADRGVGPWHGALSIAVSWVWAPAIFIASMQAYQKGLAGAFWFIAPNILCFFVFAFFAVRLRELMPEGYTFSHYIRERFKAAKWLHLSFAMIAFLYQSGAIVINAVAGGALLYLASGIDPKITMTLMVAVALIYCWISGLRASVMTDVLQMAMILVIGFILIPWAVFSSGGFETITAGLGGVTGEFGNLFHPTIAWTMGIPLTLSLITGPFSDQMFHQRAMAVKNEYIKQVFVRGGLIFGIVPIVLSLLGFVGVSLVAQGVDLGQNQEMVGAAVIGYLLPKWALYLFIMMAFAGLCSTLDSAFCGLSAIGSVDLYKAHINEKATCDETLKFSRRFMVLIGVLGLGLALLEPKLLWVFFIYGALAATGFVPTFAAVFMKEVKARSLFLAIWGGFAVSVPLSLYANINENADLIVISSLAGPVVGGLFLMIGQKIFKS